MRGLDRLRESAHPRLATIVAAGLGLMVIAGVVVLLGTTADLQVTRYGLPIAVVGYLLFMFGGSGYLAMWVFERRPEP